MSGVVPSSHLGTWLVYLEGQVTKTPAIVDFIETTRDSRYLGINLAKQRVRVNMRPSSHAVDDGISAESFAAQQIGDCSAVLESPVQLPILFLGALEGTNFVRSHRMRTCYVRLRAI